MKKLSFVLLAITAGCILLLGMGSKGEINSLGKTIYINPQTDSDYSAKYKECISARDVLDLGEVEQEYLEHIPEKLIQEINQHISDYETSMESTINSLNTIDAHNFLHDEYQRCRNLYSQQGQSELKKYYYLKIMLSCYAWDKQLNQSSEIQQVALQK
nr:hypothetical protein [Allomuricauda sp.]